MNRRGWRSVTAAAAVLGAIALLTAVFVTVVPTWPFLPQLAWFLAVAVVAVVAGWAASGGLE